MAGSGIAVIDFVEAQRIHESVNNSTEFATDLQMHGRDFWQDNARVGDCEDYALAKRRLLMEAGYDSHKMHVATCWTERGEYHAVLIVETERGHYVLDNRFAFPMEKQSTGYKWDKWECGGQWFCLS